MMDILIHMMARQLVDKQDEFRDYATKDKKGKGKLGSSIRSSFLGQKEDGDASGNKQKRRKFKTVDIPNIENEKMIVKMWSEPKQKDIENVICTLFCKDTDSNREAKMLDELIDSVLNEMLSKLKKNACFENVFIYGICKKVSEMNEFDLLKQKEWLEMTCDMLSNEMHVNLCLFDEKDLSKYGFDKFQNPQHRGRKLDILDVLNKVGFELDFANA